MKKYLLTVVGLVAVLMLSHLSYLRAQVKPAKTETLKIGITSGLSGMMAPWGIPMARTFTLQCDMYNEAGGVRIGDKVYMIKYVLEDDKGTAAGASTVANKLIFQDKVDYIVGISTTQQTVAMGPICQENNVLLLCDGTAGPGLGPKLTWVFRPHITGYERALASTTWMVKNKPEIKTVALLGADTEGGHFDNKTFKGFAEALTDWRMGSEDYYAMGTKDYYSLLTKILAKTKPDLIFTDTATPGDLGLIIKQSRELGYNGIILNNTTVDMGDIVKIAGVRFSENVYIPNYSREITPEMKKLTDAYYGIHKEHNDLTMFISDSVPILIQALQGAGTTDKNAVKKYLESGVAFKSHHGPDGFFYGKEIPHFGIDHQFLAATPVARIRDGKVELVGAIPPKEMLTMVNKFLQKK